MKEILLSHNAPVPVGPYSLGTKVGNLIFLSGQIAPTVQGHTPFATQTNAILTNIKNILESFDLTMEHIIKTTIFLTDMNQFDQVNTAYATHFPSHPPARSCVAVRDLPKNSLVEIEAIVTTE